MLPSLAAHTGELLLLDVCQAHPRDDAALSTLLNNAGRINVELHASAIAGNLVHISVLLHDDTLSTSQRLDL